jgi:hypothetical protein
MPQEYPTIYRARNVQEAHLLRDTLEAEGIRAMVTNAVLEGGSGVDIVGWPTLARVMVAAEDSVRARQIAVEFDGEISGRVHEIGQNPARSSSEAEVLDVWPCCPECGKRRLTRCPICGTSGADFPPAYLNRDDLLGLPLPPADAPSHCSCGPGGCGKHEAEIGREPSAADEDDDFAPTADPSVDPHSESASPPLLICPTCDEPFHPQYLRRCEWCGHEFPDGGEMPLPEEKVQEPFNWRIAYVIYVLALLAVGLAVYLWWLF